MSTKPEKLKYILYARKSTESEDKQVLSIDSQIDELKRIANLEDLDVIDVVSESRSAKTLGRPVFAEVIERIVSGEANAILCWKLDRLARNFIDGGKIIEMIQHGTIKHIRAFDKSYYPQDNVLVMSVEFGMANQYSRDLAVNVTRGMRRKAEMGWYPVQPPIGYLNSKNRGKGNQIIVKDEIRFELVRKMWDLMLTGKYSVSEVWRQTRDVLRLRGHKGTRVSLSNIYYIFGNPFYYGMYEWPRRSGNWYKGKHEPMITIDEYDRVQFLLGRKGSPRKKTHEFAFTGIMKCGECGAAITAEEKHKHQKNGKSHHYIYYHCTKRVDKNCSQKTLEENKLTDEITEKIHELDLGDHFHDWAMKWLKVEHEGEAETRNNLLTNYQKEYNEIVKRLDRYIEMRADNELTDDEFRDRKTTMLKEKARLTELLNDTDHRVNSWAENMENAFKFIAKSTDKLKGGTLEQRKEILAALGSNHILTHRKLFVDMDETLLPVKELAKEVQSINDRLEPPNDGYEQEHYDEIYSSSPKVCSRQESNLHQSLRRALFCPLNYGSKRGEANKLAYLFPPNAAFAVLATGSVDLILSFFRVRGQRQELPRQTLSSQILLSYFGNNPKYLLT